MKRKIFGLSLIICLALVLCFASVFATRDVAKAENVDVLVDLNDSSLLTAYSDYFVYTNSKTIYIAKDNALISYVETRQFDKFIDIAINSTHILAIVQIGDNTELWAYTYSKKIDKFDYDFSQILDCDYMVKLFTDENDEFCVLENNMVKKVSLTATENNGGGYFQHNSLIEEGPYENAKAFAVSNNYDVLYCIIDGDFYVIDEKSTILDPDLSRFRKITGDFVDMALTDGKILLLSTDGVYEYDGNTSAIALTEDGLNSASKICSAVDSKTNTNYVYTKSNLNAVNMYVYTDGNLEYFGCFDNTVYEHPKAYDIVKLYKAESNTTLYSSPRHLQRMGIIPVGGYYIALSERDEYIYVYYHDNVEDKTQYGYIKKTSDSSLCPASEENEYGPFLQPLHTNTSIYKYPFGNEKLIPKASRDMQLIFIDNVGQDGIFSWGWYKVGYVQDGVTVYGYVKAVDVSPYTALTAPAISKSVKLTSKKLGQYITLYALPFDNQNDAIEVAQLPEGTSVYLKEKYNKKSKWTAVYYEGKTAYVRTANVKASGLTWWQLTLAITIPCVVVAIIVATVLIVVAKKKKRIYNY